MKKSDLRKKYAGLRKKLSSSDIKKLSQDIFNNSEKLNIWDKENFHAFLTIKSKKEIDTSIIVNSLWDKEKNVFVSKSNFDTNTLENYKYSKSTKLKVNSWGIPEPVEGDIIDDKDIEVVFIPLLAFDKRGYRVGYGKGFYDKFLSNCRRDVVKVGVSFFEAEDEFINDVHDADVKLDYCVTPNNVYEFDV